MLWRRPGRQEEEQVLGVRGGGGGGGGAQVRALAVHEQQRNA